MIVMVGEGVAIGAVRDAALAGECGEGIAEGGGADATELAQLLSGGGTVELCHDLEDALGRSGGLRVGRR